MKKDIKQAAREGALKEKEYTLWDDSDSEDADESDEEETWGGSAEHVRSSRPQQRARGHIA